MALHAALVAALDHILQGVETRVLATGARQVTRPGLNARLVHRVTHRADLEVDRIEAVDLQGVEQSVHLLLLPGGASALRGPVQTPHGSNPRRAEFALGLTISPSTRYRARKQQAREQRNEKAFHIVKEFWFTVCRRGCGRGVRRSGWPPPGAVPRPSCA